MFIKYGFAFRLHRAENRVRIFPKLFGQNPPRSEPTMPRGIPDEFFDADRAFAVFGHIDPHHFLSSPNINSATLWQVRFLPTPVGPKKSKTPSGAK
jgi:hypothetical protein